jgi:hypothetical protein
MPVSKLIILLSFFTLFTSFAQQSRLSKGVNYLSEFIASERFDELSRTNNDLALVDSIYLRGVGFYDGNYSDALLALMLAAVPYKEILIELPLLGTVLNYPLTSAEEEVFNKKNNNLPRCLLFDSPSGEYGDKDKIAHFFGSAFISYTGNIFDLGAAIGYFVEVFEESFKVQSSIDERDLLVNELGNYFGEALKYDKSILPSRFFILTTLIHIRHSL